MTLGQQPADGLAQVAPVLFYLVALLTVLGACGVVVSRNIVRMAVALLATLVGVAGLYFMLNAELLAAIQLVVYAGGTLILIVFGVMLTSRNPFAQLKVKTWELFAGLGLALTVGALLVWALVTTTLTGAGELPLGGYDQVRQVGYGLLSAYLVPFELSAVLLLVVMIGAAYMARRRG